MMKTKILHRFLLSVCISIFVNILYSQTPANTQDSSALVDFYNSTNGASWTNNTNWLTAAPLSSWYGVTIELDGRVVAIDLGSNNLTGTIPMSIGNLTNLTNLSLHDNQLRGNIPSTIGNLINLINIYLNGNQITGNIPTQLGLLNNLKNLNLGFNNLNGEIPSSLGNLTNLSLLFLGYNLLTGNIPSSIWNLINLTALVLSNNHLGGSIPSNIGNLNNLINLDLGTNQLTGNIPSSIGDLTNLKDLILWGNQLNGSIPTEIGNLINLQQIILSVNQLSGSIPSSIGNLSKLQSIWLGNNQLSGSIPSSIGNLHLLTQLLIFDNKLTSPIPLSIANLPNLTDIILSNNSFVFDGGLINLVKQNQIKGGIGNQNALYDSLNLYKSNDSITMQLPIAWSGNGDTAMNGLRVDWYKNDVLIESFSRFLKPNTEVTYMGYKPPVNTLSNDVFYAKITHPSVPDLALVTKKISGVGLNYAIIQDSLALVDLYNSTSGASWTNNTNWLTAAPLSSWYGVTVDANGRVVTLDLFNNNLTGTILNSIGNLTKLTRLWLFLNNLSGNIPSTIENLHELSDIHLAKNQLTGTIPSGVWNLINLTRLTLGGNQLTGNIPSAISNLSKLTTLELFDNQLRDSIPSIIGSLTNLTNINLMNNQLSGSIPTTIGNLTNLQYLLLSNNQLSGNIPTQIGELLNLLAFDLGGNRLTGNIPTSITNLTKLESLYLYNNQLTGSIPSSIGNLNNLLDLLLSDNQLTGSIPSSISNLINLSVIDLRNNQLSGSIPIGICNFTKLEIALLENNKFTSPIPLTIANLPVLKSVEINKNNFVFDGGFINLSVKNKLINNYYENGPTDSLNLYKSNDSLSMQLPIAWSGDGDTAMNGLKVDWYKNDVLLESFSRFLKPNTEVTYIGYKPPANTLANDVFYAKITHPCAPGLTLVTKKIWGCDGGDNVNGGGGGGLESKDLGDAIVKRVYNKAFNNLNGPVDYDKLTVVGSGRTAGPTTFGLGGIASVTLSGIMPDITNSGYVAYNSTPLDITSITNAAEVIATDFTINKEPKAVAFATKTLGALYDHTKPICDRLKGASLLNIAPIKVGGYDFVQYTLKDENGVTEYATSFSIGTKSGRNNFSVQSTWLLKDYISEDVMYNFQLWAATPQLVNAMITDVLNKVKAVAPVASISNINIPATYIVSGNRTGTNLNLVLTNGTANTSGYFTLQDQSTELSTSTASRQIPFTLNANGQSTVSIPMNDLYESTISMYVNGTMTDVVYMADGAWTVDYNKATTSVSSFTVNNDANRTYDSTEYPLLRNATVMGNSSDYISVIKLVRGGGAATDLTAYKTLKLTASGGNTLRATLVKNSITNWADQYYTEIKLDDNQKDYYLSLNNFISTASKDKINANDVTTVVFAIEVGTATNTAINTTLSNISFVKQDANYLNNLNSKDIQLYPNPATAKNFTCSFYSNVDAQELTLKVTDVMGRTISTKQVNAVKGLNIVPVSLNTNTTGIHVVTLDGNSVKYNSKKIVLTY